MKKNFSLFGFSLIEIMVSMGLVGGISLVVLKLVQDSSSVNKHAEQFEAINQTFTDLTRILEDRKSCEYNLKGKKDGDLLDEIVRVRKAVDENTGQPRLGASYKVDTVLGDSKSPVVISSMTLKSKSDQSSQIEVVFVRARSDKDEDMNRAKKQMKGAMTVTKFISVETVYNRDTNEIEDCRTSAVENLEGFCDSIDSTDSNKSGNTVCYNMSIGKHPDENSPAITSEDAFHITGGLSIGAPFTDVLAITPPDGNVQIGGELIINDKLIFNYNDNVLDGSEASLENKSGDMLIKESSSKDIQIGSDEPYLYRQNSQGFGINTRTPKSGYDLHVNGAMKVGQKIKLYNGVFIEKTGNQFKVIVPNDWSVEIQGGDNNTYYGSGESTRLKRIATKKWVLEVIGKFLSGNQQSVDTLVIAALDAANNQDLTKIKKSICDSSTTLRWSGTKCEVKLARNNPIICDADNDEKLLKSFNFKTPNHKCEQVTPVLLKASTRNHEDDNHNPLLSRSGHPNDDYYHNPVFTEKPHTHNFSSPNHSWAEHLPFFAPAHPSNAWHHQ